MFAFGANHDTQDFLLSKGFPHRFTVNGCNPDVNKLHLPVKHVSAKQIILTKELLDDERILLRGRKGLSVNFQFFHFLNTSVINYSG